jgi:hypothetical protein
MIDTPTARAECLRFAELYPGPNVTRAIAAAEAGQVTWQQVHGLFARSLGSALAQVQA